MRIRGALVVMLAALSVLIGVPAAQAAPSTMLAATYNVCGNVCRHGEVDTTAQNIAYQIRDRGAAVAMLQELCYSQFLGIRSRLAKYGYSAVFGPAATGAHCDDDDHTHGQAFGVAVLARGAMSAPMLRVLPNLYPGQIEGRVMLGVTVRLPGRTVFVVTTHTTPRGPNLAVQMSTVWGWLAPIAQTRPVLFGGDLNSMPDNTDLDPFYVTYREADADRADPMPTFRSTPRKIDYLFGGHGLTPTGRVATACVDYSDHCMYLGVFR